MKSYTAAKLLFEKRVEIVETYLNKGGSLRKIAYDYGISYMTLWAWVNQYKKAGKENLRKKNFHKSSNKSFPKKLEKQIMLLKENQLCLTIKQAVQILKRQDLHISHNRVWTIWKRYGLVKRPKHDPLSLICSGTPEIENGMQQAQLLIKKGEIKSAANLLNKLPALTDTSILKEIPEGFLSPRRKLERLYILFNTIPCSELFNKLKRIRKNMEKKGYLLSSIIAGFLEVFALQRMRVPEKQLKILNLISKRMVKIRDKGLRFTLHVLLATTRSELLQVKETLQHLKECRKLLASLPYPFYWMSFGDLLTFASRYKESIYYYKKVIESEQTPKQPYYIRIALLCIMTGQYRQSLKFLNKIKSMEGKKVYMNRVYQIKANICFAKDQLEEAVHFYRRSFEIAKSANFRNMFYAASLGLAQVAQALGRKKEAYTILKRCLPLMKRYRMRSEVFVLQFFINRIAIPKHLHKFPVYRLLFLLQKAAKTLHTKDYYDALRFARRRGLLGIFHRYIVFFPEVILHMLEKGKTTGLPKAILKFPVLNQKIPVYHIRLLGNIIVYKNQQCLKTKLMPKEKALLIHVALKLGGPDKIISLKDLFVNFWPKSANPSSLLAHFLVRLKKKLRLPGYLLMVSSKFGESRLVNCGVHLTTDYRDFEIAITHAKALERAGEWRFAKREYLRAFKLFRGEPFKKMYDNWSEDIRRVILNRLESGTINFTRSCLEHKNMADAKKVLEKVAKIIPQSEESQKLLETL
jgi:transposase/tetratricopeptide (TPR) repeat protein